MLQSEGPLSVRERLEAVGAGIRELQLLRRRQQELVRGALRREDEEQEQRQEQEQIQQEEERQEEQKQQEEKQRKEEQEQRQQEEEQKQEERQQEEERKQEEQEQRQQEEEQRKEEQEQRQQEEEEQQKEEQKQEEQRQQEEEQKQEEQEEEQKQEELVKKQEEWLSGEEKLLQENILLLRKQLDCLRRRDSGLIHQLQELDRQISDLRLDSETSHDQLETDSRPSSGFYELSDTASGSLYNSSNSVFSECVCSTSDNTPTTADDPARCLECDVLVVGSCDVISVSGSVHRSLLAPPPTSADTVEPQSKFHCDLVDPNGSEIYCYPSPLHAVAVQGPGFLLMSGHGGREGLDGLLKGFEAVEGVKPESFPVSVSVSVPSPAFIQSSSWRPASSSSFAPSQKRLDSYIFSLLQRRALPVRTCRPRTSISTDPAKSVLRQASLCRRSASGAGFMTQWASEPRPSWPAAGVEGALSLSPLRPVFREHKSAERENPDSENMVHPARDYNTSFNSQLKQACQTPPAPSAPPAKGLQELSSPQAKSFPESEWPLIPLDQKLLLKSLPETHSAALHSSPKPLQMSRECPGGETNRAQSYPQTQGGTGSSIVHTKTVADLQQNSKNVTDVKEKTRTGLPSDHKERRRKKPRHRSGSQKFGLQEASGPVCNRALRRARAHGTYSSQLKHPSAFIPEGQVHGKHTALSGASRHHHHGNHHQSNRQHYSHYHHHCHSGDHVVVKPKFKRHDDQRLRSIMEVPKGAQRRHRNDLLTAGRRFQPANGVSCSPYAIAAGSDSEYSADCASLFHSTIADRSGDEKSNYTANRFGDIESSEEEYVEESTATSDTEESRDGRASQNGRGWSQLAVARQQMSPAGAKALVKVKVSHNLKKKILRFKSGSLKLMTTV